MNFPASGNPVSGVPSPGRSEKRWKRSRYGKQCWPNTARGLERAEPVRQRLVKLARFLELVNPDASDEQAVRAAEKLGLHRSDAVIRQFLANAGRLMLASRVEGDAITERDVATYYREHRDQFREPAVLDLRHVYIADGGSAGKRRAKRLLAAIRQERLSGAEAVRRGDLYLGGHHFRGRSLPRIAADLGGDVPARLAALPDGEWSAPIRSAYGWHLIHRTTIDPSRIRPLSDVRDKIRSVLQRQRQQSVVAENVAALRDQYDLVIGDEG